MNRWILLALLLLSFSAVANDKGGNGAEPFETYAKDFPEPEKLEAAIHLAREKISSVKMSEILQKHLLDDLSDLVEKKKFRFLDNIVIITNAESSYQMPRDYNSFIGLGAMTGSRPGNAIYFSGKSLEFDVEKLAKVIIHELLHHVLALPLSHDEKFVEDFATGIMEGAVSPRLEYGYRRFFYPRTGMVLRKQLLYSVASLYYVRTYNDLGLACQEDLDCFEDAMERFDEKYFGKLPENLAKSRADDVYSALLAFLTSHVVYYVKGKEAISAQNASIHILNYLSEGRLIGKSKKDWERLTINEIFFGKRASE